MVAILDSKCAYIQLKINIRGCNTRQQLDKICTLLQYSTARLQYSTARLQYSTVVNYTIKGQKFSNSHKNAPSFELTKGKIV